MAATAAPTRFHIAATGHSLNYLPQYIAERHGYFRDEGLAISVSVPSPWDNVLEELGDGTAAAALGGIWVPSMYRSAGKQYTAFAQLSNRCPLALVARGGGAGGASHAHDAKPFHLAQVVDKTVLLKSGNGASVGLFFKMLLREHGIDPAAVHFVQDLAGPMLRTLFEGGLGDYFVLDIVSARILAQTNADVHVVLEMAAGGDAIPWSVYYCETETLGDAAVVDAQTRFCMALERGMRHVLDNDAETYRDDLAALFPGQPTDVLVAVANLYRANQMWTSSSVSRQGFARWQKGIADGRLTPAPLEYDAMVANRTASGVVNGANGVTGRST
ncbi:uncharacterized protein SPSK_05434 [Sporothrix schenckii 1099-18]|uniref:4-amino-5-hydroxymethyl-2-methylpyrimidine phosphate synthase n=2 Tax=Sporothrix schenckii TaxID=29908 RepID=U7Q5Y8_SPOS1|nr:uncharacterized protein SPSK_05434 [Sporothrix schenckii 1099-18]ERT02405.1 hypothetical protein HMPREF1624_00703 [Sporothrix schenckii ATCC 58251]KJR80325.1 hypothetical protein SPSK_05434 [Sporothrix schenckii 1099-18]